MRKRLIVSLLLVLGFVFQAQAANLNSNPNANRGTKEEQKTVSPERGNQAVGNQIRTEEQNQVENQGENIQIKTQEQNKIQEQNKSQKDNKGQITAQSHRSTVAAFVQSLLAVADREGGIGQQVRVIAQEQNNIKDKVAEEIAAVESRSKIKTFFFGPDYKNLGELRSQMVQTRNQIAQLTRLANQAESDQNRIELQNQIQTLEQERAKIENFIAQNESQFSLFGWLRKLFSK